LIPFIVHILSQSAPIVIIPSYSSLATDYQPYEQINFKLNICNTSIYTGFTCGFQVAYNQPFVASDVEMGNTIKFFVFAGADNCSTVLCQNNPGSSLNNFDCSFVYDPIAHGNAIYIYSTAAMSDDLKTITWNVKVTCNSTSIEAPPKVSNARKMVDVYPALLGTCDPAATIMPEVFPLIISGAVRSTNNFNLNDHYFFQICGDGVSIKNITTLVQGTDLNGAFTSYICPSEFATGSFCYPVNSPVGFNNPTTSGYNKIFNAQLSSPQDVVYLTVRGAGLFNMNNAYILSVFSN